MAKKKYNDNTNWTSEDIDNRVYSKKKPLSIKEQKEIFIDAPRNDGIKAFKKGAQLVGDVARLHPVYGIGMNFIDMAEAAKNKDVPSYFSNTGGAMAKGTYELGKRSATRGITGKNLARGIKGVGILIGAQDYVSDIKKLYNDASDINFKNGGTVNMAKKVTTRNP